MKKWLLRLTAAGVLGVVGFFAVVFYRQYRDHREHQAWLATAEDTASPNVSVWRDSIPIDYQNDRRTVHVYLPPGYAEDSLRYPVIYMMDGDGCFSDLVNRADEWQIDEVIDSTVAAGGPGAIVIGIESAPNRDEEYTPFPVDDYPNAHGERYVNWLAQEFKPWVDAQLRTLPAPEHTTIGGISRSGMMAYYAIMSHPETFGRALIQSPSMWVDEERLLALEPRADMRDKKIFVSVGELEAPMVPFAESVHAKFAGLGLGPDRLRIQVFSGLGHWHLTWRKSFAMAYPWLVEP